MSYNVNISLNGINPPFNARINYTKLLEIMFKVMYRARKCDITILKNKDASNKMYDMRHLSNMVKNYYVRRIHPKTKNGLSSEIIDLIKDQTTDPLMYQYRRSHIIKHTIYHLNSRTFRKSQIIIQCFCVICFT